MDGPYPDATAIIGCNVAADGGFGNLLAGGDGFAFASAREPSPGSAAIGHETLSETRAFAAAAAAVFATGPLRGQRSAPVSTPVRLLPTIESRMCSVDPAECTGAPPAPVLQERAGRTTEAGLDTHPDFGRKKEARRHTKEQERRGPSAIS